MRHAIVGHEAQRAMLKKLCFSGRLPSTLLLAGASGIGKSLVADELAQTLVCEEGGGDPAKTPYGGCQQCSACKQSALGHFPDLHIFDCAVIQEGQIESIRELLYTLLLRSFSGRNRTVILKNADELSVQSTNVLLKALEEPRPNTYFILLTANRSKLLPTLLSRCHTFHFEPLTQEEMLKVLSRTLPDFVAQSKLSSFSYFLELAEGSLEDFNQLQMSVEEWESLGTSLDRIQRGAEADFIALSSRLVKDKEGLPGTLKLLRILARSRMRKEENLNSKARWAVFLTNTLTAERLIFDRNLGAGYVLNALFARLLPSSSQSLTEEPSLLESVVV